MVNGDQIRSKRDHNNYEVAFPQVTESSSSLKKEILIETYVPIKTFPTEKKYVSSYILDYLQKENEDDIIKQFELAPFEINVQNIDRTFIDKVFAVCDYYEQQKFDRHSRHLYDLHKILMTNCFDITEFQLLYEEVRKERKQKPKINISSGDEYDVMNTLKKIIRNDLYKEDYQNVTEALLFENVSYEDVKDTIEDFMSKNYIP